MAEPLLMLPGLLCDRAAWQGVADLLGEAACRVVELPDRDDLGAIAEALLRTAPERFALAGHSMGGRVALEMVRRAPARVVRLALLDTGFRPLPPGARGETEREHRYGLLALARERGMRAVALAWSAPMVHPARRDDERLTEAIVAMIERSTPERFGRQIEALLARPDAESVLAAMRCPTLVLCGREDTWAPVAQHRELAERVAGSTLTVVEQCGHMAPMERAPAVAAALRQWLRAAVQVEEGARWANCR